MKDIYILGYNQLGLDFWSAHISFCKDCRILFFRDGKLLLKHLDNQPDLVIVDDYFCKEQHEEHGLKDLKIGLALVIPHITTFFFSPSFSGKTRKSSHINHFYSCLDSNILEYLNKLILKPTNKIIAA